MNFAEYAGNRYEQSQQDPQTAQVWCLHLYSKDYLMAGYDMSSLGRQYEEKNILTGEYLYHSWEDWAEQPHDDQHDVSICLYFNAPDAQTAFFQGSAMAESLNYQTKDFAVTTAGDWAEHAQTYLLHKA